MMANVIGAGLAGCEASWALANRGVKVTLYEMKPQKYSPAHSMPGFAELVCSNSLKADRVNSAAGLLKEEMRRLGSLLMQCAAECRVPAGGALAVDREIFSKKVTEEIRSHPNIKVRQGEVTELPEGPVIIATGPLTSKVLSERIKELCGSEHLSFFDAAAPIVEYSSIDLTKVFAAARYGRGDDDYLNCPMDKDCYERFIIELVAAERAPLKDFELEDKKVYEGCMPVEIMAARGPDTLSHGPLKPVGLRDPSTGKRPWAVVQLRRENADGTLWGLVGFQTNLKFGEQKRVFSMIPGLENAVFSRYGVMHRNTFIDSPRLLEPDLSLKSERGIYFAGQITGVEGYMESAACGILAGINLYRRLSGQPGLILPCETMIGALIGYISNPEVKDFQPMGVSMGLLPPIGTVIKDKAGRYMALAERSLARLDEKIVEVCQNENNCGCFRRRQRSACRN